MTHYLMTTRQTILLSPRRTQTHHFADLSQSRSTMPVSGKLPYRNRLPTTRKRWPAGGEPVVVGYVTGKSVASFYGMYGIVQAGLRG